MADDLPGAIALPDAPQGPSASKRPNTSRGPTGVGLRAAIEAPRGDSPTRRLSQSAVEQARRAHQEAVWEKLDGARERAQRKTQRIAGFSNVAKKGPRTQGGSVPGDEFLDDFDF